MFNWRNAIATAMAVKNNFQFLFCRPTTAHVRPHSAGISVYINTQNGKMTGNVINCSTLIQAAVPQERSSSTNAPQATPTAKSATVLLAAAISP